MYEDSLELAASRDEAAYAGCGARNDPKERDSKASEEIEIEIKMVEKDIDERMLAKACI